MSRRWKRQRRKWKRRRRRSRRPRRRSKRRRRWKPNRRRFEPKRSHICRIHSMQMPCALSCQEEAGQAEADAAAAAESQVLRDLSDCRPNLDDQLNVLFHSWAICLSNGWRDMLAPWGTSYGTEAEKTSGLQRSTASSGSSGTTSAKTRGSSTRSGAGASESCGPWQPLGAPSSSRVDGATPLTWAAASETDDWWPNAAVVDFLLQRKADVAEATDFGRRPRSRPTSATAFRRDTENTPRSEEKRRCISQPRTAMPRWWSASWPPGRRWTSRTTMARSLKEKTDRGEEEKEK